MCAAGCCYAGCGCGLRGTAAVGTCFGCSLLLVIRGRPPHSDSQIHPDCSAQKLHITSLVGSIEVSSCPRSIRFDGSWAPLCLLCGLVRTMRDRRASTVVRRRIPVRHARVRADVDGSRERGDPLCSVGIARWRHTRLRPTHAVRVVRADARVSARIGDRVPTRQPVTLSATSRSPTSRPYGAVGRDVPCTSCTPRPASPRALTAHSAQKRPI